MLAKAGVLTDFPHITGHDKGTENECWLDGSSTQRARPMDEKACSCLKKSAPEQVGHDALDMVSRNG